MCPFCKSEDTRVVDSRYVREQAATRRRRCCNACQRRFTTYERVERTLPVVIKRDGHREAFNLDKLRAGVQHACHKRPVPSAALDALLSKVERHFAEIGEREVTAEAVGEVVLHLLREIDEVAYVRFASVYRDFSDVGQFVTELARLQGSDAVRAPK
ncbi:MAG: transcriptional repressor NrdR [Myxococcales bacterium]|nr:transcriptional repressor NrdR [Myxococcales bacterium]